MTTFPEHTAQALAMVEEAMHRPCADPDSPEPEGDMEIVQAVLADVREWIRWGPMRNLHDAIAAYTRGEHPGE